MPMELEQLPQLPLSHLTEAVLVLPHADRPVTVVLHRLDHHADLEVQRPLGNPVIPIDGQTKGAARAFWTQRHLGCPKHVKCFLDNSGKASCRPDGAPRQGDLIGESEGKQSNQISDRLLIRPSTDIASLKGLEERQPAEPPPFG